MKIKPSIFVMLLVSAILFLTALCCLSIRIDSRPIISIWEICLVFNTVLIVHSMLATPGVQKNMARALLIDVSYLLAICAILFFNVLGPGFIIKRPFGLAASLEFEFISSALIILASVLCAKDALIFLYGYNARSREALIFLAVRLSAIFSVALLGGILFIIIYNGIGIISWGFLTEPHRRLGQAGGISTAIMGSLWMVLGAMLVSSPLGIGAAIYLQEYSKSQKLNRIITIAISCLNGVPSVVFGLFGLAFLVSYFGVSLISGSIVLGLINIPMIILTTQEAIKSVPNSLREGSYALGATKWQTIKKVVLPSAMPGILTGVIMGVAKASGETAPIMWTAVTFTATPIQMIWGILPDPFQPVNNLDYHLLNLIYFLGAWDVEARAWGTALVLIALVLGTNMLAILVRNYYRKKVSW